MRIDLEPYFNALYQNMPKEVILKEYNRVLKNFLELTKDYGGTLENFRFFYLNVEAAYHYYKERMDDGRLEDAKDCANPSSCIAFGEIVD